MTANRDELHHLIDELPDEEIAQVLADVRRRAQPHMAVPDSAFAWIGSASGPSDLSTNPKHLEGFGSGSL